MDTTELPKNDSAKIVTQALSFQRPDRLPVFDGFWGEFEDKWRGKYCPVEETGIEDYYWVDLKIPVAQEQFFATQIGPVKTEGEHVFVNDGWGRVIRTKPGTYFSEPVERIFKEPCDLDKIEFEPAELDIRYQSFLEQVNYHRQRGRAVFIKIGGVFIRSCFFRGETEFLMDLAVDESFAAAIAKKVSRHLLNIGLESLGRAQAHDFGVWIYDDMCNVNAPMFSPKMFERVFLPIYKEMVSALKSAGARWVILHCDGNLTPFLDLLVEAGIDGVNPVEHGAGMDAARLVSRYHGQLSFIGGICNTHILPSNDLGRIRKHVEGLIDAGKNGGLVIGSHSIGPDINIDSYELYRRLVADQGLYQ